MPYIPPAGGGAGTVTSVALTAPAEFTVTGSPITGAGTLAIARVAQAANTVLAGPTSGGAVAPTYRALVAADLSGIVLDSPHMTSPTVDSGNLTYSAAANVVAVANTASALQFTDGTNAYHAIDTRTTVSGVVAHSLSATGPTIASASGVTYSVVSIPAVTTTLTGTTTVTALNGLALTIAAPTVTDASAGTVTTASTVYIAGPPVAAGSAVLTNKYALHVASGICYFAGGQSIFHAGVTASGANGLIVATTTDSAAFQFSADVSHNLTVTDSWGGGNVLTIASGAAPTFPKGLIVSDAQNVVVGSTTGTKIGTATTQKLGFWNATPIIQPSAVGSATGYAAGTTAATFHSDDTYTGNVGSTAYTVNGIVAALKNIGAIAS